MKRISSPVTGTLVAAVAFVMNVSCGGGRSGSSGSKEPPDPHIVQRPGDLRENPESASAPTLQAPIYQCGSTVVVKNFIPGALIEVFVAGNVVPVGSMVSFLTSPQNVKVTPALTAGQVVTARQTFGTDRSGPSNAVTVTSFLEDFPDGLPKPRIDLPALYACGRAVGIADTIPSALYRVFAENPRSGGGFDPAVEVGSAADFPYTFIGPAWTQGAHAYIEGELCTSRSPRSDVETVQAEFGPLQKPVMDPVHQNVNIVSVFGPGPSALTHGVTVDVFADNRPPGSERVGGQPSPGTGGQQVFINPAAPPPVVNYTATQSLCAHSPPSDPTPVIPCSQQPPAKIRAPQPGDTEIEVTEYIPGARILIFANGQEIGDSGPPVINLTRPVNAGETIVVLQRIGNCDSAQVYQIAVECPLQNGIGCNGDWPAYRHDGTRAAEQTRPSALGDPTRVRRLQVAWQFPRSGDPALGDFRASPVAWRDLVYVGNGNGKLFALEAATGNLVWQYPPGSATLDSQFHSNPSSFGIAASVSIGVINREREVVILGAPDGRPAENFGSRLGSGRLFALDPRTGAEIWKSTHEVAVLNGTTAASTSELHEQFGYSSPLILGNRIFVGIANHGDNPIQNGKVAAAELPTGNPVGGFAFQSTGTRGGGIWGSVAGGLTGGGIYVTTGNARRWNGGSQSEPSPNHSLSMMRLDPNTGAIIWEHHPVPFAMDDDPDWASGPTLLATACGENVVSTMKDGWTWAVRAGNGTAGPAQARWQFPNTGPFNPADGTVHGDSRYQVPGAGWKDVFFTMDGGSEVTISPLPGLNRLHALNICSGGGGRVRWIVDLPGTSVATDQRARQVGPPTVTRGIVYVGTAQGHLVAIADPSVWPSVGSRCSKPDVSITNCVTNGLPLVPNPNILLNLPLNAGAIFTEPTLARGRVFVATSGGRVFMLEPR